MAETRVGVVTHYFGNIAVAAVEITKGELEVGDTIHIKGHTSDFKQSVESMQVDNRPVDVARPGDTIGIKVVEHAREHDAVFKLAGD